MATEVHLAGAKIRQHRVGQRLTREAFGTLYGVAGSTVAGWETEGKRASVEQVNAIAAAGIAVHADWYVVARCPRCELASDAAEVRVCAEKSCPLAHLRAVA